MQAARVSTFSAFIVIVIIIFSVNCVKQHKITFSCSGKRSKTHYLSMAEYTTSDLLSDYYLLEDISRVVDGASRDVIMRKTSSNQSLNKAKKIRNLQKVARSRGIDLHLAPPGISIRNANKTQVTYNKKSSSQEIHWTVLLIFTECNLQYTSKNVKETSTLQTLLDHYIDPKSGDPLIRHRLNKYSDQKDSVEVLLKAERQKSVQQLYHKLSLTDSIQTNLKDKTVLEYPVLHVILRNNKGTDQFPLVENNTVIDQFPLIETFSKSGTTTDQFPLVGTTSIATDQFPLIHTNFVNSTSVEQFPLINPSPAMSATTTDQFPLFSATSTISADTEPVPSIDTGPVKNNSRATNLFSPDNSLVKHQSLGLSLICNYD